jgi:hypothetical protein
MCESISRPEISSAHNHETPRHRGTEAKFRCLLGVSVPRCVVIGRLLLRTRGTADFRRVVGIATSLLIAAPGSALACPVCVIVGPSDNTWAYHAMTAMLILLPLAMIGGTVFWLARVAARADATEERRPEWTYVASGLSRKRDAELPPEGGSHVPSVTCANVE